MIEPLQQMQTPIDCVMSAWIENHERNGNQKAQSGRAAKRVCKSICCANRIAHNGGDARKIRAWALSNWASVYKQEGRGIGGLALAAVSGIGYSSPAIMRAACMRVRTCQAVATP